jgi:hypothetical protein
MSHPNNQALADRAVDDAVELVASFSDNKVKQVLHLNYGVRDGDRDDLIEFIANDFFYDYMNAPTPVG